MKKQSFTLVELLVVVGIIALLAGLIIPAVGMAQTSARRTACLSNQGQVMKIMRAYMNEGDRQFLPGNTNFTWTQSLESGNKLQNDMTVARCPAIIPKKAADLSSVSGNDRRDALQEAYGMIYSPQAAVPGIDFKSTRALRFNNDFIVAANQLALGGCSAKLENEQVIGKARMNFDATAAPGADDDWGRPTLLHGGQVNIFFLDGHTESFTKDGLYLKRYYTRVSSADNRDARRVAQSEDADWIFDPDAD